MSSGGQTSATRQGQTPAMRQFYEVKSRYRDAIVLFRMGDFYETFGDDARLASKELEITLTARGKDKDGNRMPLAGIPYHALDSYLPKLIKKGYKVAICEQVEDPKKAKGIVRREVVRVVTPGTIIESPMLESAQNNYIASIISGGPDFGLSLCDITTGELMATVIGGSDQLSRLRNELAKYRPREVLLSNNIFQNESITALIRDSASPSAIYPLLTLPTQSAAKQKILDTSGAKSLEGLGLTASGSDSIAAASILGYLDDTYIDSPPRLDTIHGFSSSDSLILDATTLRNLEVVNTIRGEQGEGTLLSVLDRTCTPMGSRMLRRAILSPFKNKEHIESRLDMIESAIGDTIRRHACRSILSDMTDIERLSTRLCIPGQGNARDLAALRETLARLPRLIEEAGGFARALGEDAKQLHSLSELFSLLAASIVDSPPATVREGGMICAGYSQKLDEINSSINDATKWLLDLETSQRQRTGIKSLKVAYNNVFGYYIEVTKANIGSVPDDFIRKQTTAQGERYYTPELKEKEAIILGARERTQALEYEIFQEIKSKVALHSDKLLDNARRIAKLDLITTLADVACQNNYTRPKIDDTGRIVLKGARHPVIENCVETGFIPNDTIIDNESSQVHIITGPNMAGKSTYMRQVALVTIMAQCGSYVPADYASVGLVDRIFTRVGAFDDLKSGQSTFMVEMVELANILNTATPGSLILLDEIGRGTSTFDGLSIAWAVVEYLHRLKGKGARTLFATHYHQLTQLEGTLPRVRNYHISVKEERDKIIFLRKVVPGSTDKSYGIQVAKLAGVPESVIKSAKDTLRDIEAGSENLISIDNGKKGKRAPKIRHTQTLFLADDEQTHPVIEKIKKLDIDNLTPVEALTFLHEIQKSCREDE